MMDPVEMYTTEGVTCTWGGPEGLHDRHPGYAKSLLMTGTSPGQQEGSPFSLLSSMCIKLKSKTPIPSCGPRVERWTQRAQCIQRHAHEPSGTDSMLSLLCFCKDLLCLFGKQNDWGGVESKEANPPSSGSRSRWPQQLCWARPQAGTTYSMWVSHVSGWSSLRFQGQLLLLL